MNIEFFHDLPICERLSIINPRLRLMNHGNVVSASTPVPDQKALLLCFRGNPARKKVFSVFFSLVNALLVPGKQQNLSMIA